MRSLGISSKVDLSQPPEGFVDPNSREGIPDAVSSLGDTDAEDDILILISIFPRMRIEESDII